VCGACAVRYYLTQVSCERYIGCISRSMRNEVTPFSQHTHLVWLSVLCEFQGFPVCRCSAVIGNGSQLGLKPAPTDAAPPRHVGAQEPQQARSGR
jgi:hypothetical protein